MSDEALTNGSGAAAVGEELRRSLPPSLVEALDKISDQISLEIMDPLLCAGSEKELTETIERVFPKFRDLYVLSILILQGSLREDVRQFTDLTIRRFRESEELVRSSGPQWIGQPATLNALQGLSTVAGIVKAAIRRWQDGSLVGIGREPSQLEDWANSLVSYRMTYLAVQSSLTLLMSGRPTSAKLHNVVALANQSNRYAVHAYHLSKVVGLLKPTPARGPIDHGNEDDIMLANAGLESYVKALDQYDKQ